MFFDYLFGTGEIVNVLKDFLKVLAMDLNTIINKL